MNRPELLQQRQSTHGDFHQNAAISQTLKVTLRMREGWSDLHPIHREAIEMICLKISRIMSGQSMHRDHWDDIAGYAQLGAEACDPSP